MEHQNISCSIVLYKHGVEFIRTLIKSLLKCRLINTIYLVDNSPTDNLKVLADEGRILYIFNNKNIGFGAGHNIAMRKAASESKYHVVINPDIIIEEGSLEKLFYFMEDNPYAGHVMPNITYPNGETQYNAKLIPSPLDLIFRRFLPSSFTKKRMCTFELRESGYNKIMEAPYLSGCFMFLRMKAVEKIGYFDERFFMYPEDIDLTRRMHKAYKTLFFPEVSVIHVHEKGSYKSLKLLWIHTLNMIRYFNKWGWIFDGERTLVNKKILEQFRSK